MLNIADAFDTFLCLWYDVCRLEYDTSSAEGILAMEAVNPRG